MGPIDTQPAIVQIIDWWSIGDNPLSKPRMVTNIYIYIYMCQSASMHQPISLLSDMTVAFCMISSKYLLDHINRIHITSSAPLVCRLLCKRGIVFHPDNHYFRYGISDTVSAWDCAYRHYFISGVEITHSSRMFLPSNILFEWWIGLVAMKLVCVAYE